MIRGRGIRSHPFLSWCYTDLLVVLLHEIFSDNCKGIYHCFNAYLHLLHIYDYTMSYTHTHIYNNIYTVYIYTHHILVLHVNSCDCAGTSAAPFRLGCVALATPCRAEKGDVPWHGTVIATGMKTPGTLTGSLKKWVHKMISGITGVDRSFFFLTHIRHSLRVETFCFF